MKSPIWSLHISNKFSFLYPQTNSNSDRTIYVVFPRFRGFSFTINSVAEAKRCYAHAPSLCLSIQCVTSLGLSLRVIVNEKPLYLEKTTSSILSVLLSFYVYMNHSTRWNPLFPDQCVAECNNITEARKKEILKLGFIGSKKRMTKIKLFFLSKRIKNVRQGHQNFFGGILYCSVYILHTEILKQKSD